MLFHACLWLQREVLPCVVGFSSSVHDRWPCQSCANHHGVMVIMAFMVIMVMVMMVMMVMMAMVMVVRM